MKKIDKLIVKTFIGPFILTTVVVVFIFLMRFLMMYFNDFVGKDLDFLTYVRLFTYFSLTFIPLSLPLSILLASLMCFGNLGQYFELTAIKASGIPVSRVLMPAGGFAILICIFSFFYNNVVSPYVNLKGYSLLWDVKTTKLTLNIKEGIFYKELPDIRLKVSKKLKDGDLLKGITIYDHRNKDGNSNVTIADSGKMYTFYDNKFLCFELYNGNYYADVRNNNGDETRFQKVSFKKNKLVFALDAFGMKRTDENQFKYHEYMKNVNQLNRQVDSLNTEIKVAKTNQLKDVSSLYIYHRKRELLDTSKTIKLAIPKAGPWVDEKLSKLKDGHMKFDVIESALASAKGLKSHFETNQDIYNSKQKESYRANVEKYHKYTLAFACFVMFLIGASLGSIIKKGGFGMPVLLSISFFILMYILMQLCDKYVKEGLLYAPLGVCIPDFILLLIGIYFLGKARNDARLFEKDVYDVYFDKLKTFLRKKKVTKINSKLPELTEESV